MTTPTWRVKDRSAACLRSPGERLQLSALALSTSRVIVSSGWARVSGAMPTEYTPLELRLDFLVAFGLPEKQHSVAMATVAA